MIEQGVPGEAVPLHITGPEKFVAPALAAVEGIVRQYAVLTESVPLSPDQLHFVGRQSRSLRAAFGGGGDLIIKRDEGKVCIKGTCEQVIPRLYLGYISAISR